ncbi:MAG: hypothetical protein Kow0042_11490 [Calditrichia bacterium]
MFSHGSVSILSSDLPIAMGDANYLGFIEESRIFKNAGLSADKNFNSPGFLNPDSGRSHHPGVFGAYGSHKNDPIDTGVG